MIVGSVKELKDFEARVGLIPAHVQEYVNHGHSVLVEKGLGEGSGFDDAAYLEAGATLLDSAAEVWDQVDFMIKVKEPIAEEYDLLKEGLILYILRFRELMN